MPSSPTIAASEDMDYLYVLRDHHTPTGQDAVAVLVDQAFEQWGHHLDARRLPKPVALWYRDDGDTLQPCAAADGDSRWWVFANVPFEALELDVGLAECVGTRGTAVGAQCDRADRRLLATLDIFGRLCKLTDHNTMPCARVNASVAGAGRSGGGGKAFPITLEAGQVCTDSDGGAVAYANLGSEQGEER